MFKVQHKKNHKIYNVYQVRQDMLNNIHFLVYADDTWKEMIAKDFKPYTEDKKVLNG